MNKSNLNKLIKMRNNETNAVSFGFIILTEDDQESQNLKSNHRKCFIFDLITTQEDIDKAASRATHSNNHYSKSPYDYQPGEISTDFMINSGPDFQYEEPKTTIKSYSDLVEKETSAIHTTHDHSFSKLNELDANRSKAKEAITGYKRVKQTKVIYNKI